MTQVDIDKERKSAESENQVFRLWKEEKGAEGTRNLHKKLDQFSVFAGRNPLKVATGICIIVNIFDSLLIHGM